jgi:hypothetical protein
MVKRDGLLVMPHVELIASLRICRSHRARFFRKFFCALALSNQS